MVISSEQLEEFKVLYKKHFGRELTGQEAYDKALKLVRLVKMVYTPLPSERSQHDLQDITDAV